jgi:hypothetical protein
VGKRSRAQVLTNPHQLARVVHTVDDSAHTVRFLARIKLIFVTVWTLYPTVCAVSLQQRADCIGDTPKLVNGVEVMSRYPHNLGDSLCVHIK